MPFPNLLRFFSDDLAIDLLGGVMYWTTLGAVPPVAWHVAGSSRDVEVVGSLAYVADGNAGLQILDVSDPTAPREIGFYDTPGRTDSLAVVGAEEREFGLAMVELGISPRH